jgi:hypothetical protein
MSYTFNTSGGGNGTGASASFNITGVNVGDVILVWPCCNQATAPTVADGQGSYTAQGSYVIDTNVNYGSQIFSLIATASGTHAVVITFGSSIGYRYIYWVGTPSAAAYINVAGQNAYNTSTNPITTSLTTTQSATQVVSFSANWAGSAASSQSGTNRGAGSVGTGFVVQDQTQSIAGAVTPSVTYATTSNGQMNAIALGLLATITPVQVTGANSLASPTLSFASLPQKANTVFVGVALLGTGAVSVTGVTDNQSNTYVKVGSASSPSGTIDCELWWCQSIGTPSGTFTVTAATTGTLSASNQGICLMETPPATADKLGSGDLSSANTTLTVTSSAANTYANELVLGLMTTNASSGVTYGLLTTGYTNWFHSTSGTWESFGYKNVSAIETSAATGTWATGNGAAGVVASFYASPLSNTNQGGFFW